MSGIFLPSLFSGGYKLAPSINERLTNNLKSFKNRVAAHRLAVFLSRFHSSPRNLGRVFPIDRRCLADHKDLGLTEAQVRGAISTLVRIGFIETVKQANKYKRDAQGVRRVAIQFVFAAEFKQIFFLIGQMTKSPKDRLNKNYKDKKVREALPLGDLVRKPAKDLVARPIDLATVADDRLRAALERLAGFVSRQSAPVGGMGSLT